MSEQKVEDVYFTEMELHCIVRHIQLNRHKSASPCYYCKYAFECIKIIENIKEKQLPCAALPLVTVSHKIEEAIEISPFSMDEESEEYSLEVLKGSWIANYPELLEKLKNVSIEEQVKILTALDITKYKS